MSFLYDYTRNIAVFLIFSAFAEIIIPNDKYKVFIRSVIGFFIIIIVLNPLFDIFGKKGSDSYSYAENEFNRMIAEKEGGFYSEEKKEKIRKDFSDNLEKQAAKLLDEICTVDSVDFYLENDGFNVERVEIRAKPKEEKRFFRIEKLKTDEEKETEFTDNIKKIISDFYNVSRDNIYIRK